MESGSGCDIGMIGLGVMGRNLLLNIADHGFSCIGYDREPAARAALVEESGGRALVAETLEDFLRALQAPRNIMLLVPAGAAVEAVLRELTPLLQPGDLILDGGNSHFRDTDQRMLTLAEKGMFFLGVGISGGEKGARTGPSIMPGGPAQAYERVQRIFEAIAAQVEDDPCVAYMGPRSAGHYVKMAHNGIEYGLLEILAESYDLMKRGLGYAPDRAARVYDAWNDGELRSFLVETAAVVLRYRDEKSGEPLIERIQDAARQKGTGAWAAQEAMDLQAPIPIIEQAVAARNLSSLQEERQAASRRLPGPDPTFKGDPQEFIRALRRAVYAAFIMTYSQGMSLLAQGSRAHDYQLNLAEIARIWRGGCIIRARLLERIRDAFRRQPDLPNLLLDAALGAEVAERAADLRVVVCTAANLGIPIPALCAALAWFDGYRSAQLPTSLIQAQRDCFGAHTYERTDEPGAFHTQWDKVRD